MSAATRGFTSVTYVATLDVPRHVVEFLARLPATHRGRIGSPRRSRALGPFRQAVPVLRWFREFQKALVDQGFKNAVVAHGEKTGIEVEVVERKSGAGRVRSPGQELSPPARVGRHGRKTVR